MLQLNLMLPSYLYPSVVENESIFISKQRFIRFWFCRFFTPFNFQNRPFFFAPMSMTLSVRIRFNNLRFNSFLRTNRKSCRPIERCRKYSKNWEWKITDQERKKNWQKFDVFIVSVKSSAFIYATRVHRGLSFSKYENWHLDTLRIEMNCSLRKVSIQLRFNIAWNRKHSYKQTISLWIFHFPYLNRLPFGAFDFIVFSSLDYINTTWQQIDLRCLKPSKISLGIALNLITKCIWLESVILSSIIWTNTIWSFSSRNRLNKLNPNCAISSMNFLLFVVVTSICTIINCP